MTLTAIIRTARRLVGHHVPAADDNQPGSDVDDLWTCRHILRKPLADPDSARDADHYLRQKGEETP